MARNAERGMILVVVLWGVMFLAVIASSFLVSARTELHSGHNLASLAQARALADAGANRAILGLLEPALDRRWRGDGRIYTLDVGDDEVRIAIQDEAGKVDLNLATQELLTGLFASVGVAGEEADSLADAILDWRDADDLRRLHGAEEADYRAAGYAYGPSNRPFQSIEEVQLVMGMTPALYSAIAGLVTVYSHQAGIDPAIASPAMLNAIPGLDDASVAAILNARNAKGEESGIPMYRVPSSPYFSRSPGNAYCVHSQAHLLDGTVFVRHAVIRLTGDPAVPYVVQRWNRGARNEFVPSP
jgi:general secretion pathway protein K